VRHGAVAYFDDDGRPVAPDDVPLTVEGREQAEATRALLDGVELDRVIASGLPRTVETAALVAPGRDVETWPELREITGDRFSAIPPEELEEAFVHAFHGIVPNDKRFLGGETIGELFDRVLPALERLLALLHPVMPHVTEEIWSSLPERSAPLIVSPWPDADELFAADVSSLDRVQEAAQIFRRSGVQVELGSDDERRIFAAVVRPERVQTDGNREAETERLRKEVARAEGMLANERFVANAPEDVVVAEREKLERYRRELAALEG